MEIVKKNIVSVILAVVAIIAIAVRFYPLSGFMDELQGKMTTREAQFKKANDLVKKHRTLPVPDPADTTPRDLPVFPEKRITEDAKALMGSLVSDSTGIFKAAMKINIDECALRPEQNDLQSKMLLIPSSLPDLRGSLNDEFKKAIPGEIDRMRTQILNGGFPPSADEMTAAQNDVVNFYNGKIIKGGDGQPINGPEIEDLKAKALAALPDKLRNQISQTHKMYVDPTAIQVPPDMLPAIATPPTQERMYYVQAALWAEEDICHAIADANYKASDTSTSVVKRLLHLDVQYGQAMYLRPAPPGLAAVAGGGGDVQPTGMSFGRGGFSPLGGAGAPSHDPPALDKPDYSMTPTGRYCNKFYDVVNISLDVHVDATKLPAFLASLSRNRLVTVRNITTFSRVDNNDVLANSFIYGTVPVADVVLDVEQLQMREWTVQYMPPSVKTFLGADVFESQLTAPTTSSPATPGTSSVATPSAAPAATPVITPVVTPVPAPTPVVTPTPAPQPVARPSAPAPTNAGAPRAGH